MLLTVDSSVIVASIIEKEEHHNVCKKLMSRIANGHHTSIAPYSTLVEVVGALKRRTNSGELAESTKNELQNMTTIYFIELTKERADSAASIASKLGMKGMDALVVQIAKENAAILVTLDKPMANLANDIVKVSSVEGILKQSDTTGENPNENQDE